MRSRANSAGRDVSSSDVSHQSDREHSTPAVSANQCLPLVKFFQCQDIVIDSLANCVETAKPGDVVCFQTGKDDPLTFAAEALARGASAILTEQLLPCPLPQAVVGDVQDSACRIAAALHDDPAAQMLTIGIVGDSGKTTTALLIAGLLKKIGIRTGYQTDLGSSDGIIQSTPTVATADGLELISRLAEARDAGCGAMVIEYSGSQSGTCSGLKLDLLVVTGTESLETSAGAQGHYGPDMLTIALEQTKDDAVVIVPADQPKLVRRVGDSGLRQLTYGLRRAADVSAKVFDEQPGQTTLMVSCGDETAAMETLHCGEAMAMNSLAAVAVGLLLETSLSDAIAALCQLPMIPGRMQRITGYDTAAVVIDAAKAPEQLAGALRTIRRQRAAGGKIWCLFATGSRPAGSIDQRHTDDQLARCGRLLERFADRIILTSTANAKASFLRSSHSVLDGFKDVAVARLVANPSSAIQWAVEHAAPDDTIVIFHGDSGETAMQRRKAIERLEAAVESARSAPAVRRHQAPATIPMPGVGNNVPNMPTLYRPTNS
jgi:UDP-N-acetylmuramoyl-L-alanyl-D-glutamate--2,6-diaminopimelate ligase